MKYWRTGLTVHVLDFEFDYPYVVKADTYEEAEKKIKFWASDFYAGDVEETENGFEFNCGCPIVQWNTPHEITKEKWQ